MLVSADGDDRFKAVMMTAMSMDYKKGSKNACTDVSECVDVGADVWVCGWMFDDVCFVLIVKKGRPARTKSFVIKEVSGTHTSFSAQSRFKFPRKRNSVGFQ